MSETKLASEWTLWYHPHKSDDWSQDSYMFIYRITTAEGLWGMLNLVTEEHLKSGMYFLMRDDIFPDWSDERNIDGGYWSLKIVDNISDIWHKWIGYMAAEVLCDTCKGSYSIQGISLSPKLNHAILKVWNSDSRYTKISFFNKDLDTRGCKYFAFDTKI